MLNIGSCGFRTVTECLDRTGPRRAQGLIFMYIQIKTRFFTRFIVGKFSKILEVSYKTFFKLRRRFFQTFEESFVNLLQDTFPLFCRKVPKILEEVSPTLVLSTCRKNII